MPSGRRKKCLLAGGALLVGVLAWAVSAGPVLVHVEFGPMQGDPRLMVLNPVRSRAPERYGAEYLRRIQTPSCLEAVAALEISPEQKRLACSKQDELPVTARCALVDRSDEKPTVWLLYHCPYADPRSDAMANIELRLRPQDGGWVLRSYERVY